MSGGVVMFFAAFSYGLSLLLIAGGFLCLYLGFRLVRMRSRSAQSKSTFAGKIGEMEFTIGAGSLAALALGVSVLWVAIGVASTPNMKYSADGERELIEVHAAMKRLEAIEAGIAQINLDNSERVSSEQAMVAFRSEAFTGPNMNEESLKDIQQRLKRIEESTRVDFVDASHTPKSWLAVPPSGERDLAKNPFKKDTDDELGVPTVPLDAMPLVLPTAEPPPRSD